MSGNQIHAPPQRAASRRFTQSTIQEGGGAEVEPGGGNGGPGHVGQMRQQRREVTLAGQRRREVTLAGQRRREVTLAGQRRREVTLAGQRRREVTLAGQAPTRRSRRDRRPPGQSRRDPWQRLGPRGTETQEAERAHIVSRTEAGSLGHGRSRASAAKMNQGTP